MIGALLWMSLAWSADDSLLAPDVDALDAALERGEQLVADAETLGRALGRVQNHWAQASVAVGGNTCELGQWIAVARAVGAAQRDRLQSARMQRVRIERLVDTPTIAPLVSAEQRLRIDALGEAQQDLEQGWLISGAWQAQVMEWRSRWCKSDVLVVGDGLSANAPLQGQGAVAIVGVGGGLVCPLAEPADGRALVTPTGEACWTGSDTCDCVPAPVQPGAVLGPDP